MDNITPRDSNARINRDAAFQSTGYSSIDSSYEGVERESWKGMVQHLYTDVNNLWQKESLLIRTELNEKVTEVKTAASAFAIGGAVLLVGLFALVATAIIGLDVFLPLWLSAVIVTAVLFIVGGSMLAGAKKKFEANRLKPTRSIETLSEIKNTFQERIHEFKRH
jgi:membrane-bound ClpP family serine protease